MKTLLLFLLLIFVLSKIGGGWPLDWYSIHLYQFQIVDPLVEGIVFFAIAGALIMFGFLLAISLLGALLLATGAVLFSIVFIGLHMFWPVLLLLLIIYLVAGGGKQAAS